MENNEALLISGNRGSGKTMLASVIVGANPSIKFYTNFMINKKNVFKFEGFEDLRSKLKAEEGRKCVIIDETQKLLNSRRAMTSQNIEALQFIVESRKYDSDIIMIAQTMNDIDKQIREQCDWIVDLTANNGQGMKPVSSVAKIYKKAKSREDGSIFFAPVNIISVDGLLELMQSIGVEYNTKEEIHLNSKNSKDEKKQ